MTFETPRPVSATVGLILGELRLTASERDTTVVEVRPSDATNKEDVQAAEKTRVECAGGRLTVTAPRSRSWNPAQHRRVDRGDDRAARGLEPAGQRPAGGLRVRRARSATAGSRTASGRSASARPTRSTSSAARGTSTSSAPPAPWRLATGSGDIRVGALASSAVIKNSNGDTWVGVAGGELRLNAGNGSLAVDRAERNVVAKAANGDVRLGEVVRGTVVLETAVGDVEIGIPEGTAAYLDVNASAGRVENLLAPSDAPAQGGVEVRARTALGNVVIRRPR